MPDRGAYRGRRPQDDQIATGWASAPEIAGSDRVGLEATADGRVSWSGIPLNPSEFERRRRLRDSAFGVLECRTLIFVAGALLLIGSVLAYQDPIAAARLWALTLLSVTAILGAGLLTMSMFGSDAMLRDLAERASIQGYARLLGLGAAPFVWMLRKVRGR